MSLSNFFLLWLLYLPILYFDLISVHSNAAGTKHGSSELPIVIIISFDGFRYDYLEKVGRHTPNFDKFLKNGVRAKWMENVFATKTFPNHFSIVTGLYEETHGIVGNDMFDPVLNDTFYMNNSSPLWWDNGFNTPLWIANQLPGSDRHSGVVMWAGSNVSYRNRTASYHLNYDGHMIWSDRVNKAIEWLTMEKNRANLVLIYIEEPDKAGHEYGPDSEQVKDKIIEADNLVGYLLDKLEKHNLSEKANVIILSDHGMAEIKEEIEMDLILNRSSYKMYGATPVWNILPAKGMEDYVYNNLLEGSKIYPYTLYKREDIPEKYHYKNNRRVLNFLVEAHESYDLVFKKEARNQSVWGNHGYNNSFPSMHPIFLAKGPLFKKGFVSQPFSNLDVYPLVCHLLGIKAPPNNGSLDNIKHILEPSGLVENIFTSSWVVGLVFLLCISISAALVTSMMTTFCRSKPPTVAYVTLRRKQLGKEREMCSMEETEQLLVEDAAMD